MLSSTSNSNDRLPGGPWGKTWLVALVMALLFLAGWELGWRLRGFEPSVPDDEIAWVVARARVSPSSVVMLGTSRIQTAVDPQVWKRAWNGQEPVQLAIFGGSPVPHLEDLAEDATFHGLVIIDLIPRIVFDASFEREAISRERLNAYREALRSPARWSEVKLRMLGASKLVLRDPALSPRRVLEALLAGRLPDPPYAQMRENRFMPLDFSKADRDALFEELLSIAASHGREATPTEVDSIIRRIDVSVERIRGRGGQVVFVLMPRCGEIKAVEDQRYPRDRYWDVFVHGTHALTLNAEDEPALNRFQCPDGSHIDVRDTPVFTAGLARAISERLDAPSALGGGMQ